MKLHGFTLTIPEGRETSDGYVQLAHNTQYRLALTNNTDLRCDVEIHIDGGLVGLWRIGEHGSITLERPAHDPGKFTFYGVGTPEARKAGIRESADTGLIRAVFKPERDLILYGPERAAPGGTGLSGRSDQRFVSVESIDYDESAFVTINLRLVGPSDEPRPLFPRETPIPPPV